MYKNCGKWTLTYRSEKLITRLRQDTEAVQIIEEKTIRVAVGDIQRYAKGSAKGSPWKGQVQNDDHLFVIGVGRLDKSRWLQEKGREKDWDLV